MITLLVADDHPLYRDALRGALFKNIDDLNLLEASNLDETVNCLSSYEVDLLLFDLHMPGSSDLFGFIHIRKLFPDLPVAVISGLEDVNIVAKVMQAGALGFIPKTTSAEHLAQAVRTMLAGDLWLPESMSASAAKSNDTFSQLVQQVSSLTPAQYKVLCLLRDGLLNKQIGYELEIAEATVKAHITAVFRKLGINNRTQAVLIAAQLQLNSSGLQHH
jgi:DNA-binding NarL/FixJ family response regulator